MTAAPVAAGAAAGAGAPEEEVGSPVPPAAAKWLLPAAPVRSGREVASAALRFCEDKDVTKTD